jgi:hypothetical protein
MLALVACVEMFTMKKIRSGARIAKNLGDSVDRLAINPGKLHRRKALPHG